MAHKLLQDIVFLKTVIDTIPMSVIILDEKAKLFHLNDYLEKILNISTTEAKGRASGEVLGCINLLKNEKHICGYEDLCKKCIVNTAYTKVVETNKKYQIEGFVNLFINGRIHNLSISVNASPFYFEEKNYVLIIIDNLPLQQTQCTPYQSKFFKNRIIGKHQKIKELHRQIDEAAQVEFPVLIQGESGTGKELVARAIHNQSKRSKKPFIALNCASLPPNLLESELFGHVKGAFTGAFRDKKGRFELADQGTVFLDEIGELAPEIQAKLLRFLQEKTFEKVGGDATIHVDIRVIAATNKVLKDEVQKGMFRLDLFYRIGVIPINMPPLRKRKSDIPLLTDFFIRRYDRFPENKKRSISEEMRQVLTQYDWPGNVRELQNVIKFSLMKCKGNQIELNHLPLDFAGIDPFSNLTQQQFISPSKKIDKKKLVDTLIKTDGNKTVAAEILGVSRTTLYRYIKKSFPSANDNE